jgi:hypothetical protein
MFPQSEYRYGSLVGYQNWLRENLTEACLEGLHRGVLGSNKKLRLDFKDAQDCADILVERHLSVLHPSKAVRKGVVGTAKG